MKGPAIFLAQFAGDEAPFNSLPSMAKWAASLGYKGIQVPDLGCAAVQSRSRGREPGLLR